MILQTVNGIPYRLKQAFNFDFLAKYGQVFKVFDDQDSGNICFGIQSRGERLFVKFAGAHTAQYEGDPIHAVERLKATLPVYQDIVHENLIRLIGFEDIGGGFAMIFHWADGECMGRMYEESHAAFMCLPVREKLEVFRDVTAFLQHVVRCGYVAIDFYDGSIMYDRFAHRTTICDIDFFRKSPAINDMGRMWGSERFMSPEEYTFGASLDEVTNVFTLGQMAFSLFTDSDRSPESWPLSAKSYSVLMKAISPMRECRYQSIADFRRAWESSI